jgi:hypothetical protein
VAVQARRPDRLLRKAAGVRPAVLEASPLRGAFLLLAFFDRRQASRATVASDTEKEEGEITHGTILTRTSRNPRKAQQFSNSPCTPSPRCGGRVRRRCAWCLAEPCRPLVVDPLMRRADGSIAAHRRWDRPPGACTRLGQRNARGRLPLRARGPAPGADLPPLARCSSEL